eukprot:CAMPEP_0172645624 /NCGR_PEP_ID=MMETSP1068-20121228/239822_1 /TAXON_ID=35684 /ORGANISM="Pseudopedinella elastica, Strain CCMP716" /LENGTH=132 /DNA_ID=CAMNT_0013459865 /DNA_START=208 /DNA_END=607 /DNA_ORIENTATION=+
MRTAAILIAFASVATAFVPSSVVRSRARVPAPARENVVVQSTFWDGAAPPSQVLGPFLSKQSSSTLGLASLIFLAAGLYSCHTNNVNVARVEAGGEEDERGEAAFRLGGYGLRAFVCGEAQLLISVSHVCTD